MNSLNSDAFLNLKNIRIKKPKKKKNPKKALKQKKTYSSNTLSKPLTFLIADTLEKFKEKKAQTLLKTKEKEQKELSTKQKISQINKKIRITNRFRFASRNVKPNMKKAIKIQEVELNSINIKNYLF